MRSRLPITLGLVAVVALGACTEEEETPEPLRAVRSVVATAADEVQQVTQTGEIVARRDVPLAFKLGGRLLTRPVEAGAVVKAGDLLATIDPRDLENQLRIAEAEVEAATAGESVARTHVERQRQLASRDIVSKAAVEAAEADWQAALARVEASKAQLAAARDQLSYAELRAPEGGTVIAIAAQPGEVVAAGQPVLRIAAGGEREAAFNISEKLVAGAQAGLPVGISLVSDPQVTADGILREISPAADPVTRTYRVLVSLKDAPERMGFGATVEGTVAISSPGLMAFPAAALTNEGDLPAVFVVEEGTGLLKRKPVTIARYEQDRFLVTEGIEAGDRVVTAGVSKLRPDQAVTLMEDGQ
ncbi:MAG: hypothetical protein Q27BPR15_04310 [Rhodobacter sp. CACIA14H1]|nr:MAG: hypothetical protein Q27BPR15_04310 [Rhodobacter sp. CACIA14H1]